MGNSSSVEKQPPQQPASAAASSSACPVVGQPSAVSGAASRAPESGCPVPEQYRGQAVYNVYNQRIDPGSANAGGDQGILSRIQGLGGVDPVNQMPREPNQQPVPGQKKPLPRTRVPSSIPKGGTDSAWLYPSPQMFYNALKRKNKGDDVMEDDMAAVVYAHNNMNEATWQRLLHWEQLHRECGRPALTRFLGRPNDLSPLARLKSWVGGPLPFDRHDWYVDRCGREVRYVIDFYFDEEKAGTPDAFEVTVRPALDSPGAALDRVKMNIYTKFAEWGLPCPITGTGPSTRK